MDFEAGKDVLLPSVFPLIRFRAMCFRALPRMFFPLCAMAASLNVDAVCDKIAPDTESKYNAAFWTGLSVVVSALDNVQARLYIDSKCVEV